MAEGSAQKPPVPRDAPVAQPVVPEAANLAILTAARDGSQKDLALALEVAPASLHARDAQGTRAFVLPYAKATQQTHTGIVKATLVQSR